MDWVKNAMKPKPTPQEQLREWQRKLRNEARQLEIQVREIEREEKKVEKGIKEAAKRNDMASAKHLAKEILRSRKAVSRMYEQKAQMNSISLQLGQNLATARTVGHLAKSTEVMQLVNGLMKAPQIAATMQDMSKEMMKAGLIDEMVTESLDDALDTEDIEEETEEEVNRVLDELAVETTAQLPNAVRRRQEEAVEEEEITHAAVPGIALGASEEAELAALKSRYK